MMRALGKEVFETLKVLSKRFARLLLELHYILPNKGGLVDSVEFLQEDLDKIIPRRDRINR